MYKISVIVPVYNTEKYLDKCLESLINQTMNEIEIILVDDGSTDNSRAIIDKYVKEYPNKVKSIIQRNSGQASARNKGIEIAKGEFIAFVDSDDFLEKNAYENVYNYAKMKDLDIVCFNFWEIKDENKYKSNYYNNLNCENDIVRYVVFETSPWNKIIKRKLIEDKKIRFLENHIYEDLELIPTLALYTKKIGFINECYYNYIIRENSTMRKKIYDDRLRDIYPVMDSLYHKLVKYYDKELEYLYIEHLLHGAAMRFLDYEESINEIETICKIMKEKFPNWRKNYYYKQMNIKYKIICNLIYNKKVKLLKILIKK